ncbi:DUF4149 domain-containing protein [Leptospirillum ferrooxidans]|jgi:hypothetical protein|uniref:Putative arylamine N-acetyltransferase n=1 Tax=Leptospirillum ferrooxidans (strain C2-3) TaxID=1162668 RepID=I0IKJ0_LEPFC|nr:DUF4149 domain-containing protein [Leptospirillum ferrooxidans]BAM05789.1 putative arylamine N-acetyltransferase [Leptospirillum ferrooxidans C2-3]
MLYQRLLRGFYSYILIFLTGATLFLALFVAPLLFTHLGIPKAAEATGVLFPPYFHLLFILSLVELALSFLMADRKQPFAKITIGSWFFISVINGLLAGVLGPEAIVSRTRWLAHPADLAEKAHFDKIHELSVILNSVSLVMFLTLCLPLAFSFRPSRDRIASENSPSQTHS